MLAVTRNHRIQTYDTEKIMKISKFVFAPLLVALALSMSACDRSDLVSDESSTSHEVEGASTTPQSSEDGGSGMGMTYSGKLGIDMGGGLVMPLSGGMHQLGVGF